LNEPVDLTLEHDETAHRYQLLRDGTPVSLADYREVGDGTLVFHHTLTPVQYRGNGYAEALVARALDDVRESGRKVVATCWFVEEFLELHPEYQDLRA
jgi:predicted GNAT family acetyltransferase